MVHDGLAGTAWPDSPYCLLLRPGTPLDGLPADADAALAQLLADPLAVDDAIAALRRYSLISPPNGGLVSVHRLVQAITVALLPASQAAAWQQATAALITAALPADPQLPVAGRYSPPCCPTSWPRLSGISVLAGDCGSNGSVAHPVVTESAPAGPLGY